MAYSPENTPGTRKIAYGPTARDSQQITALKIQEAITKCSNGQTQSYKPDLSLTVTITKTTSEVADKLASTPNVKRLDTTTIESQANRHCDVIKNILGLGI